jgi:hypothetical protein
VAFTIPVLHNHHKCGLVDEMELENLLLAKEYEYVYVSNIRILDKIKLLSLTPVSPHIASHCIHTLVLYGWMYVHVSVTVLTP